MENYGSDADIVRYLKDAGCREETIVAFLKERSNGVPEKCLKLLAHHRDSLLEEIHKGQKQIDCLDYFIFRMEREKEIRPAERKGK